MNTLLKIALPTTFGDKMMLGVQVVLIGMATVFSVLVLIMCLLMVFKTVFAREKKAEPVKPAAAAPQVPVVVAAPADDTEIIAVIAAAIAMAENDVPGGKFRVVSFKRK